MDNEQMHKVGQIGESVAVALCADLRLPKSTDGPTGKPGYRHKRQAPRADERDEHDASPSHAACLEDAEILEQQGDFDQDRLGIVGAVFDIEELGGLMDGYTRR